MKTFEDSPTQESDEDEMPSYEELQKDWKEQKEQENTGEGKVPQAA